MTDEQIVIATLEGDSSVFETLVTKYSKQLLVYILRLLNFHQQDAEDVLSDTFLKCYINLARFNPSLKFSSWLYRIAHNEAVNLIKKKSRLYYADLEQEQFQNIAIDFDRPKSQDIEAILARVSIDDRSLITLFYLEEKSIREISEILKTSENNVAVRLSRARLNAKKLVTSS